MFPWRHIGDLRTILKKEITQVKQKKRGHTQILAEQIKDNPTRFSKYIKGKRISREREEDPSETK